MIPSMFDNYSTTSKADSLDCLRFVLVACVPFSPAFARVFVVCRASSTRPSF